ncbi:MAG: HNH endonuclease [Candidatus Hydrogenedentes bacterium]|nr:HNH endonuclease [Candidatus Hydrogenedentota bacterium]
MSERWKDVSGYDYEVSDHGRVRRTKTIPQSPAGRLLGYVSSWGYRKVDLSRGGRKQEALVHRLVAMAFISNPNDLPEINHIDGDKLNNHVTNLEWVTNLKNVHHAYASGLMQKGERNGSARLTDAKVLAARRRYVRGGSLRAMACEYGVAINTITRAVRGKTWKHVRPTEEG